MTELYYKMMREADGDICWRYVEAVDGGAFCNRRKRWVCIQGHGHDNGVHEIARGDDA